MKKVLFYLPIVVLTAFALLTVFMSSSVIFDMFGIRAKEGNYVLFIVWANFIASILYLVAAYNWYKLRRIATMILGSTALMLIIAQVALFVHINGGGIYEEKTVKAMFFRITMTLIFTIISYITLKRKENNKSN